MTFRPFRDLYVCVNLCTGQQCGIYTKSQCYPLAFGVPAALMVVSLSECPKSDRTVVFISMVSI